MKIFLSKWIILSAMLFFALSASPCRAADVLVVADTTLKPVVDVLSGIDKTVKVPLKTYAPSRVKATLGSIAAEEQARVVVALGREAIEEALRLPPTILVIYGLVVVPPSTNRPNTTGFYMATPTKEYVDLIGNHLRGMERIAVLGSRDQLNILSRGGSPLLTNHSVRTSFELVSTLKQLDGPDAILLLPDASLLTATVMEQAYLLSFKQRIPLLGISEKNVKDGALLALVVDPVNVGRLIGEEVTRALRGGGVGQTPPSPPKKFDLFINLDTARRMGIRLPEELVRSAKRTFP